MPRRQFSKDFGDRLMIANVRMVHERDVYINAIAFLQGAMQAFEDQKKQLEDQCIQTDRKVECFKENEKIRTKEANEEFERHIAYLKELQAIDELQRIIAEERSKVKELDRIIAEVGSEVKRNAELVPSLNETMERNDRRLSVLRKWHDTLKKIYLTMKRIEAWNTVADEAVSVQRIETENASEETDRESTTVETVERKISSEVDDGGSSAGTMEKVEEFSTDGKLATSERGSSEILPCKTSEEQLEVKQSSSEIDQESIADRIEARELSAVAGRSTNEVISVQRIETENASKETDGESTAVEMVERKIISEVDDGGSSAGTIKKVEEFSTDGKLTTSEKESPEILPCKSSEEQLEVKSSSEIDQGSIADRIEAQQELSEVAGKSTNEAIEGFQKSTEMDADRTQEIMAGLARLENNLEILKRMRKCLGLPEESSSDTDEKRKERLERLSLQFQELDELFGALETVKIEFLEL